MSTIDPIFYQISYFHTGKSATIVYDKDNILF